MVSADRCRGNAWAEAGCLPWSLPPVAGRSRLPRRSPDACTSGTADALRKAKAVDDSLVALQDAITKWKTDNAITGVVTQTAQKPEPHPYWRSAVAPELFLPPDVVTDTTYTLCWKGVVSPVVCTSGTKVCW